MTKKHRHLPRRVLNWLTMHQAWLVGSGARWYVGDQDPEPGDIDVIIPPEHFMDACKLLGSLKVLINSFGGFKAFMGSGPSGKLVDFWPMTIGDYMAASEAKGQQAAYRMRPRTIVRWDRAE